MYEMRRWDVGEHLRHIEESGCGLMYDDRGNPFPGIKGRHGVRGLKEDGSHIGGDFIAMQPGAKFPLHTHEGEHEIYFIQGRGFVRINGEDIPVRAGHVIHIPGEYPHGVWVPDDAVGPLIFVAVGHPHHRVESLTRMRVVEDGAAIPERSTGTEG